MAMPDSQLYPWNFRREAANENKQFKKKQKYGYLIYTLSEKYFKGTVVNLALASLYRGSLEITLTVSLNK